MKNIKLEQPIVFVDLETTGLNVTEARIVELAFITVNPDGTEDCIYTRINPEIPIPSEATEIHGITDDDVRDKPKFREYAEILLNLLKNANIGGFGIKRFDIPLLEKEFERVGIKFSRRGCRILDAQEIFYQNERRDLTAAYAKYCGGKILEGSHGSEADARASIEVLDGQLGMYPNLPKDLNELHCFCCREEENWVDSDGKFVRVNNEVVFNFGPYKGRKLQEISQKEPGFLEWILKKDFSQEVKDIVMKVLYG